MSSNFHIKRTESAHIDELTQWNGARSTKWVTPPDGKSVLEIQTTHRPQDFKDVPDDKNLLIPPFHWHWYQEEQFFIRQGQYIFTLEDKTMHLSASSPQPILIPPGARHTFRADPHSPVPCIIEISTLLSPHQSLLSSSSSSSSSRASILGASERFFRNIYSYLEDCTVQGVSPSLPQLVLMLHDAEISLAFPGPAGLARWVSWGFGVVVGKWVGEWWLGYRSSYPEYFDEGRRARLVQEGGREGEVGRGGEGQGKASGAEVLREQGTKRK
ncbi:hypothetical protein KVT40_003716 [Elsinoe batatas]|uniref:Cupin 2 conserved barrel domain-containing protein n=1 Tax=Elsinoe batatas TaxID=2601811 RepID=A0A8K0L450_9PEZI|nr:hypothetical protein KVT40_003716 [Elsinoe batatas]